MHVLKTAGLVCSRQFRIVPLGRPLIVWVLFRFLGSAPNRATLVIDTGPENWRLPPVRAWP